MEVDQLRFELAQKHSVAEENSDLLSHDQTTLMVSRMEAMLSELAESDARSSEMEALLLAADQASKDEQEERKQIEAWVSKLENRVNQRETETESQVQQLKNLLQEARETQQKSNECLKSVLESKTSEGESVPMELANQLKKHVESLLSQLQAAQAESNGLREQLEQRSAQAVAESESEQKLAEMQLETSRERAEISRQRAELKRLEADLNARRGELSEVHGDEQAENASSLEDSEGGEDRLTSRIAELLPRVASE